MNRPLPNLLCQAVEAVWRAGIFVAVAAGNQGRNSANTNGYGTITAPGNDPYVMTVGSIKANGTTTLTDDTIASYSSKGPTLFDHYVKPDVVAPGNLVASTLPAGMTLSNLYSANRNGNTDYFTLSGTSMATPVMAVWAAMCYQASPSLTNDQYKANMMMATSKNFPRSSVAVDPTTQIAYTSYYDIFTVGAGEITMADINDINYAPAGYSAKSPVVLQCFNW